MTRASFREYAPAQQERYRQSTRAEKRQLLNEIVAVTRMHCKAAIRLLRRGPRPPTVRPPCYGPEVARAAAVLWQAAGRIGAHRLHPFVPGLLDRLTECGELALAPAVDKLVRQASRPTLARLLAPARAQYPRRGATITRPGTHLKHAIPIRTFTEWDDARPGFLEVDLVAHCGRAPRASISAPSAPSTSPPPGSSWTPSGARAKSGSAGPSTTSAVACRSRWSASMIA